MAETTVSTSWYLLVFAAMGFAIVTFIAILSHVPRIPAQRGLLAIILISAIASLFTLILTQVHEGSKGLYDLFVGLMILVILAALLDLVYFIQARRRQLEGANWSLYVALALLACGALGLIANAGVTT